MGVLLVILGIGAVSLFALGRGQGIGTRKQTKRRKTTKRGATGESWRIAKVGTLAECRKEAVKRTKAGLTVKVGKIGGSWTTVVRTRK